MKFSIQDIFSKCEQIRSFMRIWSHLLKKSLKSDSHLPKNLRYLLYLKHLKNDKKCSLFIVKAIFVLKICKFLSRLFGHVEKMVSLERYG